MKAYIKWGSVVITIILTLLVIYSITNKVEKFGQTDVPPEPEITIDTIFNQIGENPTKNELKRALEILFNLTKIEINKGLIRFGNATAGDMATLSRDKDIKITANLNEIGKLKQDIETLKNTIGSNRSIIDQNTGLISSNTASMRANRSVVTQNTETINSNKTRIGEVNDLLSSNTETINENKRTLADMGDLNYDKEIRELNEKYAIYITKLNTLNENLEKLTTEQISRKTIDTLMTDLAELRTAQDNINTSVSVNTTGISNINRDLKIEFVKKNVTDVLNERLDALSNKKNTPIPAPQKTFWDLFW